MAEVYFFTNRNLVPDYGKSGTNPPPGFGGGLVGAKKPGGSLKNAGYFGGGFSGGIRFGRAEVTDYGTISEKPEIFYEDVEDPNPDKHILGSQELFDNLHKIMQEKETDTMFYIHGFNTTFEESLTKAAALKRWFEDGGEKMNWLVFSWPSDGKLLAYRSDRDDAKDSATAIKRGLLKAADFIKKMRKEQLCKQKIHLMAHSMGAYALGQALAVMYPEKPMQLFDQILLIAADTDTDALEKRRGLGFLEHLGQRVSIYYNAEDKVLEWSDRYKGNPARLGAKGPSRPCKLPRMFTQIDCTAVIDHQAGADFFEHSYHRNNEYVRRDMINVLRGVRDDRIHKRKYKDWGRFYDLMK